jgi:hypothetical protein
MIDEVRQAVLLHRDNTECLGFVPEPRMRRSFSNGELLSQYDNDEWVGYLLSGPLRQGKEAIIYQECIDKSARRYGSGSRLIAEYSAKCQAAGCVSIHLRCAESLDSNFFWLAVGFEYVRTEYPTNKRQRAICVYVKSLRLPLFAADGPAKQYAEKGETK